ncbi:hypothetical protein [Dactylosporangium darangshiense]|uniref:hypothetical protein n=1 Tax=Dactylosporangium darangshiense TaxID=579108 RepID=UPI00363E002F
MPFWVSSIWASFSSSRTSVEICSAASRTSSAVDRSLTGVAGLVIGFCTRGAAAGRSFRVYVMASPLARIPLIPRRGRG